MATDTNHQLGKLGEQTVRLWATEATISVSQTQEVISSVSQTEEDEHAWDILLESHPPSVTVDPLRASYDRRSAPWKYWVQVKSTNGRPGSWAVKLDNWERLVKNLHPTFFLICEFDGAIRCQRAYLIHIGEDYIREVLKRLREISVTPDRELHKTTLSFTYTDEHLLPSLDGQGLLTALQRYTGQSLEEYSQWKQRLVETVGYEENSYTVRFRFPIPEENSDPNEYLVDFLLGGIPHLDVNSLEIRDTRFGIDVPELAQIFEQGRIEIESKPIRQAHLVISSPINSNQLRIRLDVFVPQGLTDELREAYQKIRFTTDFIEITSLRQGNKRKANLRLHLQGIKDKHPLKCYQPLSDIVLRMQEAHQHNQNLTAEIWIDSSRLFTGQLEPTQYQDFLQNNILQFLSASIFASRVAKHFDIPLDTEVDPDELYLQAANFQLQADLIATKPLVEMRITYDAADLTEQDICVPWILQTFIGPEKVIFILAVTGRAIPVKSDDSEDVPHMQLRTNEIQLKHSWVTHRSDESKQRIEASIQSVIDEYKASHQIVILQQ